MVFIYVQIRSQVIIPLFTNCMNGLFRYMVRIKRYLAASLKSTLYFVFILKNLYGDLTSITYLYGDPTTITYLYRNPVKMWQTCFTTPSYGFQMSSSDLCEIGFFLNIFLNRSHFLKPNSTESQLEHWTFFHLYRRFPLFWFQQTFERN